MDAKSKQSPAQKQTTENLIKDIRRKTRKLYSSEQKILIVMEALRGEEAVAAICRKHGIAESGRVTVWNLVLDRVSNLIIRFAADFAGIGQWVLRTLDPDALY